MLKAIFPFFPISSLTLICCFRSFDVVSNFLVATSINPHVFRHIIVYNSFSRACALFSILIVISYSFSSFTSSLLISYFLFSEFFFLFSALFSSKIFVSSLQVVPFTVSRRKKLVNLIICKMHGFCHQLPIVRETATKPTVRRGGGRKLALILFP